MVSGRVINRMAHPIRSAQAAVPGHTHQFTGARQIKPIWMQSLPSGTQQLGRECARLRNLEPITLREDRVADLQIPIDAPCRLGIPSG